MRWESNGAALSDEVRVLIDNLVGRGVRLAVVDRKLVVVSGSLDDETRTQIRRFHGDVFHHHLDLQERRKADLERRIGIARDYCTEERGYEWERTNWLTEFELERFEEASTMYEHGEVEFSVVQAAFVRYATTHKRRYRVTSRVNGMTEKYKRREVPFESVVMATDDESRRVKVVHCVTSQWEPSSEFAEGMFHFFGLTSDQYRDETDVSTRNTSTTKTD